MIIIDDRSNFCPTKQSNSAPSHSISQSKSIKKKKNEVDAKKENFIHSKFSREESRPIDTDLINIDNNNIIIEKDNIINDSDTQHVASADITSARSRNNNSTYLNDNKHEPSNSSP